MHVFISIIIVPLCLGNILGQSTLNVPSDYPSIQEAIDASEELDTILVAPGIYYENIKWPVSKDLLLLSKANSGNTIINGGQIATTIEIQNLTEQSMIEGFTIKNGYNRAKGAGIHGTNCGLRLKNLIVTENILIDGEAGAGAYLKDFRGSIDSCRFISNSINTGNNANGAGLYLEPSSGVEILNCVFDNNHCNTSQRAKGGGLHINYDRFQSIRPLVVLKNCELSNNTLSGSFTYGAGLFAYGDNPMEIRIDSSQFTNNECLEEISLSNYGAAMAFDSDINLQVSNSIIQDNKSYIGSGFSYCGVVDPGTIFINNTKFIDNKTGSTSICGALYLFSKANLTIANSEISHNGGRSLVLDLSGDEKMINLINTTIAFNEKAISAGVATLSITNSILWNNDDNEFRISSNGNNGIITASNSIIKGGYPGNNILDSNPLFVGDDILIPTEDSPCINAGDPTLNVSTDLLGNPRPMPPGTNPDIGAYEVNQEVVSSTKQKPIKKFKVFPNPTQDKLFFSERMDQVNRFNTFTINESSCPRLLILIITNPI